MRRLAAILLAFALPACAAGAGSIPIIPKASPPATTRPAPSVAQPVRRPTVQSAAGLEGVIGAQAGALVRRYGTPRIDLREGDARKLQFAGERCVVDIFLYPTMPGAEAVATHVEARNRSSGAATDRARCIAEIGRR